ncbi:MAG: M28 family peptidase [Deltaproteobacteria bacterium]|nr:M28 family peptidase [Deltaproteobacteria bacterium]
MHLTHEEKEKSVVAEVSKDQLMAYTTRIVENDRLSGSKGEARAVEYFEEVMTGLEFEVEVIHIENLISLPIKASVTVISPEQRQISCITQSFSASTPPQGVTAELIYLPAGNEADVAGKIIMREGLAAPGPTWDMEAKGAAGQVWINSGDLPHNMCISTIWGHPTPETAYRIPKRPTVSVGREAGEYLKMLCSGGAVKILLHTAVKTCFMKVPLAVASVKGIVEPEKYILFNGHIDSWHKGASDNGTANACMLEVARVIAKHRDELRRGIRFVWWSGHSHGRYSGSTWYADHNWEDLYQNAVVHLNVDSLGCRGATMYPDVESTAECYGLGKSVVETYANQSPAYQRIGHSGDNSFWGIGIPTLFQLLSRQPKDASGPDALIPGLAWFWHTEADTLDKIDPDILFTDARIYMAAVWRLCTLPVIPFDFEFTAQETITLLKDLDKKAGSSFDLSQAVQIAETFKKKALLLKQKCIELSRKISNNASAAIEERLNTAAVSLDQCIMKLSRILIPVSYSGTDRFDMDLAVSIPPFPRLQPVAELAAMDPRSHDFKYLERKMVRERNRVCHALIKAAGCIDRTLSSLRL